MLHHFSFNMPLKGAEMTGMEQLLCVFSTRKGVKCKNINKNVTKYKFLNNTNYTK